jgi:hypothetical protein
MSCPIYDDEINIKNLPFKELFYYEKKGLFDEFEFILITFSNKHNYDINNVKQEYRYKKYLYNSGKNNKLYYGSLFVIGCGICIYYFKNKIYKKE